MLDAVAAAVAEKGYAATTISDVVSRAGVSRSTFYEHFADRDECYLAAFDLAVSVVLDEMARSVAEQSDPWEQLRAAVRAFLRVLSEEPEYARAFLIEVLGSFPGAVERRNEVFARFGDFFTTLYDAAGEWEGKPEIDEDIQFAFVAAIAELVARWVYLGRVARLGELEPSILELTARMAGVPPDS
jgi:AcrR family transcriptional regulator